MIKKLKMLARKMLKSILRRRGQSIVPTYSTFDGQRKELIEALKISFAVDVGANVGQWALATFCLGYKGKVISLEPDPRAFEILKKNHQTFIDADRWIIQNLAAGEERASIEFNAWGIEGGSSSLLSLTKQGEVFTFHRNQDIPKIHVTVDTLDQILRPLGEFDNALLKIDVQGYEMQVLRGASEMLSKFTLVEIEVPIIDIYHGATLLPEMLIYFRDKGFTLCSVQTERWTGFGAADVDVLFMKNDKYTEFMSARNRRI
jgi:FkbM family methyltransferase